MSSTRCALLEGVVPVRPVVDNDVSWALLAEREHGVAAGVDDVLHLYLDEGMGAALWSGGRPLHGARGLAGEIAYSRTSVPPTGLARAARSGTLMECVEALGYLRDGQHGRRRRAPSLEDLDRGVGQAARALADAVAEVVRAHAYLLDPELVVLSGRWGRHTEVVEAVTTALGDADGVQAAVARGRGDRRRPPRGRPHATPSASCSGPGPREPAAVPR